MALAQTLDQLTEGHGESVSEAPREGDANLPFAAFNEPDLGSVDVGSFSKLLLGQPAGLP